MNLPLTIIIPTYNEEKYLPKLLTSIKKQTMQPKEIIVADAYSLDSTREIARSFGCKIVAGGLPPQARNKGAKKATQPLILFLDADVVIPSKFLEKTVGEMIDRNLDVTSCFVRPLSSLRIDSVFHNFVNYYFRFTKTFHPHIPGCCIFVKTKLHRKIKGFDESLKFAEDHDYVSRARSFGKFSYLKSYKIPISVRRLSKEGRLKIALKYIAIELHLIFLGNIHKNIVGYQPNEYTPKILHPERPRLHN